MRVLAVLELLQARETITCAELARRLEVSPRSVQRYILRLQDLGIPIQGKRGVGGSYRLQAGFRLPPLMFSNDEALALTFGLRALQLLGLQTLTPAAETVHAKLLRVLPDTMRQQMTILEQAVQMDIAPWVVDTDTAVLQQLLQAVRQTRVVRLSYLGQSKTPTVRPVQIYQVVHLGGRWYAVGWCELRHDIRSFRLDRIEQLELLEQTFIPPANFDALTFLHRTIIDTPKTYQISVWLEFPPDVLRGKLSLWATELVAEKAGTRMQCQRSNLERFAALLLGLGCMVQIEQPPELLTTFVQLQKRCSQILEFNAASFTDSNLA